MTEPLWFFWSGDHLTYLRWATLATAAKVHDRVVLVRRMPDEKLREDVLRAAKSWHEHQDFQQVIPSEKGTVPAAVGRNWIDDIPTSIEQVALEDVAPDIARMRAPDVQTSDLLGWWLLAEHGGTVADMDVTFFRPLPPIEHAVQVVECTGWPKAGYMPIGFLQGRPCPFWRETFRRATERYNPGVYQSCGAELLPGFKAISGDKALLPENIVYPFALVAEWMAWHPWMFEAESWPAIPDACVGIHWYGGKNQGYNWTLTHESLPSARGAVPWAIREVLGEGGMG